MTTPEIFLEFCRFFHQDVMVVYPSLEAAVSDFFAAQTNSEISDLNAYLNDQLSRQEITPLEDEWNSSGAEIFFPDGGIVDFYKSVLDHQKKP